MFTQRATLSLAAILFAFCATPFSGVALALAQDSAISAPQSEISCSSNFGNAVELEKNQFHLVPASPEEIAGLRNSKPQISAGPFTAEKSHYDRVEIFLAEKKGDEAYAEASLSVYARAVNTQKESWFKIASDPANPPGLDFFDVTPGDRGADLDDNPQKDAADRVSFAIKATQIPVFQVTWFKHETGANTFAEVRKALLLDFRSSPPAIMAALQCVSAEGGGVCGVYDNGTAPTTALVCNWDTAKGDFLCSSTMTGDYTPAVAHRFYLASGADAPYTAEPNSPATLSVLGGWIVSDRSWARGTHDIPGLGAVNYLGQYPRSGTRDHAVLFGSRGHDSLEPRFFAVIVDPRGPVAAFEIFPQPLVDEPGGPSGTEVPSAPDLRPKVVPASINASDKFADDAQPSFDMRILEWPPNVSAWQVTVKQNNWHEVFWLGAGRNPGTGRFVLSAVRIASELGDYARCGDTRTKPFAAAIKRQRGSLDALLNVEPAHLYNLDDKLADSGDQGQPVTLCPIQVKLSWNASLGFIRQEHVLDCPAATRARRLTISDSGVISATTEDSTADDRK